MKSQQPTIAGIGHSDQTDLASTPLPDQVNCLLLPVTGRQLLVPVTTVAEVISPVMPPQDSRAEGAFYGWINWRDQSLPLISYEVLCCSQPRLPWGEVAKIAVLNAIGRASSSGFYALALSASPRPVTVFPDTALHEPEHSGAAAPKLRALLEEGEAEVPNVDYLEDVVATLRYY